MNIEIDEKHFKKARKIVSDIYHIMVVLCDFCEYNECSESVLDILPVVEYVRYKSDELNYGFEKLVSKSICSRDCEDLFE